jgi:hypothetical protein
MSLVQLQNGNVEVKAAVPGDLLKGAERIPRTKLLPVLLVKTLRPRAERSSDTILVVVVFPLVPDMTATPRGRRESTSPKRRGSSFWARRPGRAEPPPFRRAIFCRALQMRMLGLNMAFFH